MQLSLSSATLDSLPQTAPKSHGLPRSGAKNTSSNAAASDAKKTSDFDDLLSTDADQAKPAHVRPGSARKAAPDEQTEPALAPSGAPLDPSASADLAAMVVFMANPVVNDTAPPPALPQFGPTPADAAPAGKAAAGIIDNFELFSSPASTDLTPVPLSPPTAAIASKTTAPETAASMVRPAESAVATAEVIATAMPVDGSIPRPPSGTTRVERRASVAGSPAAIVPGANLAGSPAAFAGMEKIAPKSSLGNFLNSSSEEVAEADESLGTDVAEPSVTMAAVPFSHRQSAVQEFTGFSAPTVMASDASARNGASPINEPTALAHRAVDAVLSAAERVSGERNSVNLQFSLAGNDLAVRVEFRGGSVHATFRTDSPELRAALESEWTAAGSKITDASVRMAPPVFTSSNAGSSTTSSGEGASQQRESARQASSSFSLPSPRGGPFANSPAEDRTSAAAPRAALSTTLHLHTFA